MLDMICYRRYGAAGVNQSVAATLEANPGLADLGPTYAAGVEILLPDWTYTPDEATQEYTLWD